MTDSPNPAQAQSNAAGSDTERRELSTVKIFLGRKFYVPLGALAGFLLAVVAAVYSVDRALWIEPLKEETQRTKQQLDDATISLSNAGKQQHDTEDAYRAAVRANESPLLISPAQGAEIVANEIPMRWHYEKAGSLQSYVVHIVPADAEESEEIVREVVRPEEEVYYFPTDLLGSHQRAFWRVVPGKLVNGEIFETGASSSYGYFTWDRSTVEHIRRRSRIAVGVSPQLTGPFESPDAQGELQGLDVELVKWLSQRLASKVGMSQELDIEWKSLPWSRLLPSLSEHEVDMVISSMTRTAEREKDYKGIRFTDGYYVTHQILVSRSEDGVASLKELDSSKTVGTLADTTNQKAARALAVRWGFHIRDEYLTFDDLYSALDSHSIDAALVDDVFVKDKLASKRFRKIGKDLDEELKQTRFYSDVIGHDQEAYAIAVSDAALVGPKGGTFLDVLNNLLRSKECRALLESQKEKLLGSARRDPAEQVAKQP